jgi:hypothetical protein
MRSLFNRIPNCDCQGCSCVVRSFQRLICLRVFLVFASLPMDSSSVHFTACELSQAVRLLPTTVRRAASPIRLSTGRLLSSLSFSCVFSVLHKFAGRFLKSGHDSFLPHSFQFIVLQSSYQPDRVTDSFVEQTVNKYKLMKFLKSLFLIVSTALLNKLRVNPLVAITFICSHVTASK